MKILAILLVFWGSMGWGKHPINISNTVILLDGKSGTVSTKLCYLDFFYDVKQFTGKNLELKKEHFSKESLKLIETYWNEYFKIWVNGKPVKITLKDALVYDQEDGATAEIICQIPNIKSIGQKIKMHNALLVNTVAVQKNIVHFYTAGDNRLLTVMLFSKDETDKESKL